MPDEPGVGPGRLLDAALELAAVGIPVLAAEHPMTVGWVDPLTICSCGSYACPTPAAHPALGLGPGDGTTDPVVLGEWWGQGGGWWNLAVVVGERVGVVELAYPVSSEAVAAWLGAHGVVAGPVVDTGRVVFVTGPHRSPERGGVSLHGFGGLDRCGHGELLMVPPSRMVNGSRPLWLAGPLLPLPDGERLWEVLAALPTPTALDEWMADHQPQQQQQLADQSPPPGDQRGRGRPVPIDPRWGR